MQNKGFVKVFAVLLTLACAFYLSFSFVTRYQMNKAAGDPKGSAHYLDSMQNQKVWLGIYTLKQCRELDILEVGIAYGSNVKEVKQILIEALKGDEQWKVEFEAMVDRHHKMIGRIIDNKNRPVDFANVALLNVRDSSLINGGVTNENGQFVSPCEATKAMSLRAVRATAMISPASASCVCSSPVSRNLSCCVSVPSTS